MSLVPPFTKQTAHEKVKLPNPECLNLNHNDAHDQNPLSVTRDPSQVIKAYTPTSTWRNRTTFLSGHADIQRFLTEKWQCEIDYRLRKELFAFMDNRIAVQFWYEYRDRDDRLKWKRCYGLEHWVFDEGGLMTERRMSGNDGMVEDGGRWFEDGVGVEDVDLPALEKSDW
ncbi:MAG: hypothetical protein M1837_000919 [Sclerophora amabilis]|nr:MAG: hypothetical protein M1837_000919 [Sclerophora amabilis]